MEKIILASSSPRRIEMFENHGFRPEIIKPEVEEDLPDGISPQQAVMMLALRKALAVEELLTGGADGSKSGPEADAEAERYEGAVIVAADTIVYKDRIIGKPADPQEAWEILTDLRASKHYVYTGVAVLRAKTAVRRVFYDRSSVFFKDYSDAELKAYIDTPEPYDKAGGYAIQETFAKYIDRIEGDVSNVIGLPWDRTLEAIESAVL